MDCAYQAYQANERQFDKNWKNSAIACGCSAKQLIT